MMFLSKVEPKKRRRRQGDTDPGTKRRGLNPNPNPIFSLFCFSGLIQNCFRSQEEFRVKCAAHGESMEHFALAGSEVPVTGEVLIHTLI